jgi:anaerobic magnesium-protoporphyrin IX monomethyl ester cyclase
LDAIAVARHVRRVRPELPIIFGGWHPTLCPAETLKEDFVDVVVRHQGERTLVEIAQRLAARQGARLNLDFIAGCWFKRAGKIVSNDDRPAVALDQMPKPAYDLANLDAYERLNGERAMPYAVSVGCPYACHYCTDQVFYSRRVHAQGGDAAASEMCSLAAQYRITHFPLVDSNFLVDTRRAVALAQSLINKGAAFTWSFQASTDLLCRMSDEEVRLMYAAGLRHIGFGTESASKEVLKLMNKHHEKIPDLYEAARKCEQAGLRVTYNLIFGYPGETAEHRRETWRVMSEITARYRNVSFSPNVFTPYPGIPIWDELESMGLRKPQSLVEWAAVDLGKTQLPWLEGGTNERLEREIEYFVLGAQAAKRRRAGAALVRRMIDWRMRTNRFAWPVELWAAHLRRYLVMRRSLLTGSPL